LFKAGQVRSTRLTSIALSRNAAGPSQLRIPPGGSIPAAYEIRRVPGDGIRSKSLARVGHFATDSVTAVNRVSSVAVPFHFQVQAHRDNDQDNDNPDPQHKKEKH